MGKITDAHSITHGGQARDRRVYVRLELAEVDAGKLVFEVERAFDTGHTTKTTSS